MAAGGSARHWVGDVIRSLEPRYLSQVVDSIKSNTKGMKKLENIDEESLARLTRDLPSWQQLSADLRRKQTNEERRFRDDLQRGAGPPSALATERLFGAAEPRVHIFRDRAAWCPYCQKVWIALEELRIPYRVSYVDMRCYGDGTKPLEFMSLQPNGNLPCVVIDGDRVVRESDDILVALDELSSAKNNKLFPDEPDRVKALCDDGRESLERRLFSRWMWWLTGVRKPEEYRQIYLEHLDEVDEALAETKGPFFLEDFSIVDIKFIPFVERQIASLAYFKGVNLRDASRWPHLVRWLEAMEARPSYLATKSDWFTHSRALPPQLAADCVNEPGGEEMRFLIDDLPVGNGSSSIWIEPGWPSDRARARRDAAERLIRDPDPVVRFAARAAGVAGWPAASAPLSDPRAAANPDAAPAVDAALREVAGKLLGGSRRRIDASALGRDAEAIAGCLDYLRARIGVPRDMSHPAAQELRGELLAVSSRLRANKVAEAEQQGVPS